MRDERWKEEGERRKGKGRRARREEEKHRKKQNEENWGCIETNKKEFHKGRNCIRKREI